MTTFDLEDEQFLNSLSSECSLLMSVSAREGNLELGLAYQGLSLALSKVNLELAKIKDKGINKVLNELRNKS